ncbi:alpha/beta hydrolase family protein [Variovorax sp. LT1R16]|uniref:alpha/beta hydrolase family protein n=1 Tax=Variovorax sp. LT1R16 TaxID=3443728 RepID=UPI003F44C166
MPVLRQRLLSLAVSWACGLGAAFAAEVPVTDAAAARAPVPLAAFAALPAIQHPSLSPDGRAAAMVQNVDGMSYVVVSRFGEKPKILFKTDNAKYTFWSLRWAGNQRLLVGAHFSEDLRGVRAIETRLIAMDADGGNLKADLTRAMLDDGFSNRMRRMPQIHDRILTGLRGEPETVLLALDTRQPGQPDVYRLDVRSGRSRLEQRNLGGLDTWLVDREGEVRLGYGVSGTTARVMVKPTASPARPAEWTPLVRYDATDAAQTRVHALKPLGFDADPRFLYALAPVDGRNALVRIDLHDPAFARETLLADPRLDVRATLLRDPPTGRVVGAEYVTDTSHVLYWDADARRRGELLSAALPARALEVVSSDEAGLRSIVRASEAARPPEYFMVDWASGQVEPFGRNHPTLDKQPLATPRRIALRSRDGLALAGFLTLPPGGVPGARPARPLPAVLLSHGGPAAADTGSYDYVSQFMASRGWAVLQLDSRGSTGYGQDFREAGRRRWGLEMQDDLADGLRWMVDQGIADAGRVCIAGSSYGGYSALMGVVKDPALYRCAVSLAGPADLRDLLAHSQKFVGYAVNAEAEIGTWWGDREQLRQTSPALRAAEIRVPVLLVHGANDPAVPVTQSRDMAEALQKAGRTEVRYVELPLGDHTLSRQQDRVQFLTEVEQFLQKNLD